MKKARWHGFTLLIGVPACILTLALLSGCLTPEARFSIGQVVRMKIDGRKVQVTYVSCSSQGVPKEQLTPCTYTVKYRTDEVNYTYSTMSVAEYELEEIQSVTVGSCTIENTEGALIPFPCDLLNQNLLKN